APDGGDVPYLGEDLMFEVLRRAEARTLASAACVSRGWRALAQDERLWEAACVREWADLGFSEQQLRALSCSRSAAFAACTPSPSGPSSGAVPVFLLRLLREGEGGSSLLPGWAGTRSSCRCRSSPSASFRTCLISPLLRRKMRVMAAIREEVGGAGDPIGFA
uniref:F-box domain-containing protein n=2 Tax=Aegilops tauschii subsp. strangulata TaxID=200361 RepID=A0A452YHM4_AEGTS